MINSKYSYNRATCVAMWVSQQYPWFVRVVATAPGFQRLCSGAVINESFVLTAASCYGSGARIARELIEVVVTAGVVQHHICEDHRETVNVNKNQSFLKLVYTKIFPP